MIESFAMNIMIDFLTVHVLQTLPPATCPAGARDGRPGRRLIIIARATRGLIGLKRQSK
jgi:hypothetical protein